MDTTYTIDENGLMVYTDHRDAEAKRDELRAAGFSAACVVPLRTGYTLSLSPSGRPIRVEV